MMNGVASTKIISRAEDVEPIMQTGPTTTGGAGVQPDDEIPRDFYVEAKMAILGLPIPITVAHLEAMQEHFDCALIRISRKLDEMKDTVLEMP